MLEFFLGEYVTLRARQKANLNDSEDFTVINMQGFIFQSLKNSSLYVGQYVFTISN